jgi:hypothetical protein
VQTQTISPFVPNMIANRIIVCTLMRTYAAVALMLCIMGCEHRGSSHTAIDLQETAQDSPSGPLELFVLAGEQGIDLRWTVAPSADVAGFHLFRSDDRGKTFTKIEDLAAAEREFTDPFDIKAKHTYIYLLRAYTRAGGEDIASNQASILTAPFVITSPNSEELDLSWAPSGAPDVHSYVIYRSKDWNFKPSPATLIRFTSEPEYQDTGLERGTRYMYHVYCVHDNGDQTLVDETTDPPQPQPAAPTRISREAMRRALENGNVWPPGLP